MATVIDKGRPPFVDKPLGKSYDLVSKKSIAITPSDTINFTLIPREIVVGGAGTVAVVNSDDTVTTYTAVAGSSITQQAKRVNATGTTATGLVGII